MQIIGKSCQSLLSISMNNIPNKRFKAYRGGSPHGLSWSLSKEKALFFQERRLHQNPIHNPVPLTTMPPLVERTLEPDEVYLFNDSREEKEVLFIPPEAHAYLKTEEFQKECDDFVISFPFTVPSGPPPTRSE